MHVSHGKCDICGKVFTDLVELLDHRNVLERCDKKKHFNSVENYYVHEGDLPDGRVIRLQGPLEFNFIRWCSINRVPWVRPAKLPYEIGGVAKKYQADFYLPGTGTYVETKGKYLQHDIDKMAAVLSKHPIKCVLIRAYDFPALFKETGPERLNELFGIRAGTVVR